MTEQELDKFYNGLEELYEYFKDYSLQNIYDSLIVSGLFDLSSKEDLDFVESFAYKIYYGKTLYFMLYMPQSEKGLEVKPLSDTHKKKEKSTKPKSKSKDKFYEFIEENNFVGKTVKEILDELSDKWRKI